MKSIEILSSLKRPLVAILIQLLCQTFNLVYFIKNYILFSAFQETTEIMKHRYESMFGKILFSKCIYTSLIYSELFQKKQVYSKNRMRVLLPKFTAWLWQKVGFKKKASYDKAPFSREPDVYLNQDYENP